MSIHVANVTGSQGETLEVYRVFPKDPGVQFLRDRLANDPEAWPFSADKQAWGPLVQAGHPFQYGVTNLLEAELYVLYDANSGNPVACATLMARDMTRAFDPDLPKQVEDYTPWRCCVAEDPAHENKGYARLIGTAVLLRAKQLGFQRIYLFVSVPDTGVPTHWRGYPCGVAWRGRYCDHIPLLDGTSRKTLPDQIVLFIDLDAVDTPDNWMVISGF